MKRASIFTSTLLLLLLSACEVEYRGDVRYYHPWGWEHRHHPDRHEVYNHGYHHDVHGNEIEHH